MSGWTSSSRSEMITSGLNIQYSVGLKKTLTLWMDGIAINYMKTFLSSLNRMMSWQKNNVNIARGVLPYISYIGMCRPIGSGFWAVVVWKRVYTLPILVWNRVWFSRELRECMNVVSFQFQMSEKERDLKIFFCLCSNSSKDNLISALRPNLKTGVENYIFWSEIRSGFREPGGHTPTKDSKEYPPGNIEDVVARLK